MHKIILLFVISLALRAGTIYQVNRTVGAGSVVGTITTDGTIGLIFSSNVTAWNLTINNGSQSAQLSNSLPNHNLVTPGTLFSATATQLLLDFNGQAGSYVFFRDNNTNNYWCLQTTSCTGPTPAETVQVNNTQANAARSGSVVIANTAGESAVPEPSTFYSVALAGALLFLLRRSS